MTEAVRQRRASVTICCTRWLIPQPCIGATTLDEYRKHIEKDGALKRRFQPIHVQQPSVEETIRIIRGLRDRYETHHGVEITELAIAEAVNSSQMIENLAKLGNTTAFQTPAEFAETMKSDLTRWGPVVKASGFVAVD